MPDNNITSDKGLLDHSRNQDGIGTGVTESGPIRSGNLGKQVLTGSYVSPAIYDVSAVTDVDLKQAVIKGAALGFNSVLLSELSDEIIRAAHEVNLRAILMVDISTIDDTQLFADHPDWFVQGESGVNFIYLSDSDDTVFWWDQKIVNWMSLGISGFMCRDASSVPGAIWHHIISAAQRHNSDIQFYASTLGAVPEQISKLQDCGFAFTVSSSCWWNFSAGWLNDDTDRIRKIAPPIALTVPPFTRFPDSQHLRRRSLALATIFGAGWLMPSGFESGTDYDLTNLVTEFNKIRRENDHLKLTPPAKIISSPGSRSAVLMRGDKFVMVVNPSNDDSSELSLSSYTGYLTESGVTWSELHGKNAIKTDEVVLLPPAGFGLFEMQTTTSIAAMEKISPDCDAPRIAIEDITPKVDAGSFPVRRIIGETVVVEADIMSDGHDKLAADIIFRPIDQTSWQSQPMQLLGNDRWRGKVILPRLGRYIYAIRAWKDHYATLLDELTKKHAAGINTLLVIEEIITLINETIIADNNGAAEPLKSLFENLSSLPINEKISELTSANFVRWMRAGDIRPFVVQSDAITVDAERLRARFANWYEVFPRSQSGDPTRHGTFHDVIKQLPRISDMGFDVLYFPPIHPIGYKNRKGRNNTLTPSNTDPGSPYAIGNKDGGHDAIHPELGSMEDFQAMLDTAAQYNIEIALDFAVQCAPDHPWLRQHKEWFDWQSDGSIRYAENPPKKYEDIVNVDFYAAGAKPSLWLALRDIVQFWVDRGIRLFRVDNPHTKPFPFWQWLINDIRARHPDVIFLAEAFTRPKVMYRLAKIGFSQSYTYFTWRNTKAELESYLTELNNTDVKEFFRPHFFVNTPDINPEFLQNSGRPGFLIRAVLAATLSGLWGVYNGFELCEAEAVPGKEEYFNSEKYQIRAWDYTAPGNIIAEITNLNRIRRDNTALHSHLGLKFHNAYDDQIIFFSKTGHDGNVILVVVSLDPFATHETTIEIPLWMFDQPDNGPLPVEDLMRNHQFTWHGKYQPVTLHPNQPFCIWRVQNVIA